MKFQPLFLLGMYLAGTACLAQGQAPSYSQFEPFKGDGYYWYAKPAPEPQKPASAPVPAVPKQDAPKKSEPLSMKWLRENMPVLLEKAVDNPTQENVSNYMYAQRVLLDKSQNFSSKVKDVVATDPFLDENNRVPISQFANTAFQRKSQQDQSEMIKLLASRSGIWLFTDKPERCMACKDYESNVLTGNSGVSGLVKEFGFNYRSIDVSTEQGRNAAKRFGLKVTPTTVLVAPPNKFILLSQGLMAEDALRERLLIGARMAGILTAQESALTLPYNKGLLQNSDIDLPTENTNPTDVMDTLRNHIKGNTP